MYAPLWCTGVNPIGKFRNSQDGHELARRTLLKLLSAKRPPDWDRLVVTGIGKTMTTLTEADVEQAALDWLSGLGWQVLHGPDVAPETPDAERDDYRQVVLEHRLRDVLAELNPSLPLSALDDACRMLTRPEGSTLEARNRAFHRMLVNGVNVEYRDPSGNVRGDQVRVIDFESPDRNDWLAVNQFTVTENKNNRRPDIVLFVNGLPLGIVELKNPADEDATIWTAWNQLQTYKAELPSTVLHE